MTSRLPEASVLAADYAACPSLRKIAERYGVSRTLVWKRLKAAGVARATRQRAPVWPIIECRRLGVPPEIIARKLGVSENAVKQRLKQAGLRTGALEAIAALTKAQRKVYRKAIDEDRVSHAEALEAARERS